MEPSRTTFHIPEELRPKLRTFVDESFYREEHKIMNATNSLRNAGFDPTLISFTGLVEKCGRLAYANASIFEYYLYMMILTL